MEESKSEMADITGNLGKARKREPTSIVATHLPTDVTKRDIEDFFGQIGRLQQCHLVRDKDWQFKGMVYVQYDHWKDAARAKETLNRKQFRGAVLKVKFSQNRKKELQRSKESLKKERSAALKEEHYNEEWEQRAQRRREKNRLKFDVNKDARKLRQGRIIIRNLSFKANEKIVEEHFSPYGKINEIKILRKDEKLLGYAFLQYETKLQALKAIQECNMKPLLGRPIAVDLAVPKSLYKSQNAKVEDNIKDEKVDIKEELEVAANSEKSFQSDHMDVKIKKEDVSDDEKDSGLEDKDDSDESDDDDDDESEEEEEESDEEVKRKPGRKPVSTANPSKDVAEERCVFIKNLSFDATEEDVSSVLSQFGDLKYVLICMDPLTEHPRGTAFAQFKEQEAAAACLSAEGDPATKDRFILLGRPMHIMQAVSRGNLQDRKKEEESDKKVKDKRNLYLAREGFVRLGTQAAIGVSQADMNLRMMREQVKRRMLKNLNVFISQTRLCVNNLPENLTDDGLRDIFIEYGEPGSKVIESRIMKNLHDIGDDGKPKSRGYGFVTFTEHEHALAALRTINNNPNVFTKAKRPIIEFSMENREVIRAREKRLEKSKEKNPTWNKGKNVQQKGKRGGQLDRKSTDPGNLSQDKPTFMGSKSDSSVGVKNALPANIGPKIRHRDNSGKITRKQLKKQRQDRGKGRKRLRVHDDDAVEEPSAKKHKEEETTKAKKKRKSKPLTKNFRAELRKDKSFIDMVNKYKQKMASVNTESSSKHWYDD